MEKSWHTGRAVLNRSIGSCIARVNRINPLLFRDRPGSGISVAEKPAAIERFVY